MLQVEFDSDFEPNEGMLMMMVMMMMMIVNIICMSGASAGV